MTADTALIESIVQEVVARFQVKPLEETVLVLASEGDVDPFWLNKHLLTTSRLVYLDQIAKRSTSLAEIRYQKVIVPRLSCSDMVDLAMGKASGDVAGIILSLLLNGQCVEVIDFEYHGFADNAPSSLWALYESYEQTLAGFGLICYAPAKSSLIAMRKRLITEQDVTDFLATGAEIIAISHDSIVTPLAADAARAHKLQIVKK